MDKVKFVAGWAISVLSVTTAISLLASGSYPLSIFCLIVFVFSCPPVTKNLRLDRISLLKRAIACGLALVTTAVWNSQVLVSNQNKLLEEQRMAANAEIAEKLRKTRQAAEVEFKENKDLILDNAVHFLEDGDLDSAKSELNKYLFLNDPDVKALYAQIQKDEEVKDQLLVKEKNKAKELDILETLKKIPAKEYKINMDLYEELTLINPDSQKYKDKLLKYTKLFEEKEKKQRLLKDQFVGWSGANKYVQWAIRDNMHDPSSYEHVETKYKLEGDIVTVYTKVRGRNAFGAKILSAYIATLDLEGHIKTLKKVE